MKKTFRYRLSEGIGELRQDLGSYLRSVRERSDDFAHMRAKEFAEVLGVTRETLSRIDNDARWPSLETLESYLALLNLEIDDVTSSSRSNRPPIPDYPDVCYALGEALNEGRKKEELSLRALSLHTGISYSQLSRLTRGQFKGGKQVRVKHLDINEKFGSNTIVGFTHPMLAFLADQGGHVGHYA